MVAVKGYVAWKDPVIILDLYVPNLTILSWRVCVCVHMRAGVGQRRILGVDPCLPLRLTQGLYCFSAVYARLASLQTSEDSTSTGHWAL